MHVDELKRMLGGLAPGQIMVSVGIGGECYVMISLAKDEAVEIAGALVHGDNKAELIG
jgi:hypothetical protein